MQIMTIYFGEYVPINSQPLTLMQFDTIEYEYDNQTLKPVGFHSSLFCTRIVLLFFPFLTYRTFTVSSVVEFDAL